jgi:hypothetical protein
VKRNYYCLVAGLQDITIDIHKVQFSQVAFCKELKAELHPEDYLLVEQLCLPIDNKNLLNLLAKSGKPFSGNGNYGQEILEDNIKEPAALPDYMVQFITAFKAKTPLIPEMSPENELTSLFFDHVCNSSNDFIRNWYTFELNLRNLVVALLSRKHGLPFENQIIGSGEIPQAIKKSHARDFGLSGELSYLDEIANLVRNDNIQEREKAIDNIRWSYLDEVTFFDYFTIDKVLAYTLKLGLIDRWLAIDKDHGNELFKKLLAELKSSYELPETFKDK